MPALVCSRCRSVTVFPRHFCGTATLCPNCFREIEVPPEREPTEDPFEAIRRRSDTVLPKEE